MTLDFAAVQQEILDHLESGFQYKVLDTEVPTATTVLRENNRVVEYAVARFTDATTLSRGSSFAGSRNDEMYMYGHLLCIASTPAKARSIAYGADGAVNYLLGFKPNDAGPIAKAAGGLVFEVSDALSKPAFYIARASFRVQVNMITGS